MEIKQVIQSVEDSATRYGLRILYLDFTDVTVLARIGLSDEVFVQLYVNVRKQKKSFALIVAGDRVYGIDNEAGNYHEHPFDDPSSHIGAEEITFDTFVGNSLHYLSIMGWLAEDA